MKSPSLSQLFSLGLAAMLSLALIPTLSAETFKGRIKLRGEVQNSARPGSISFVYEGNLKSAGGNYASVTGGGLFRSINKKIVGTFFRGGITTYTRYNATVRSGGKLVKRKRNIRVRVNRKMVRIPGVANVKLSRPINGKLRKRQQVRGTAIMKHVR